MIRAWNAWSRKAGMLRHSIMETPIFVRTGEPGTLVNSLVRVNARSSVHARPLIYARSSVVMGSPLLPGFPVAVIAGSSVKTWSAVAPFPLPTKLLRATLPWLIVLSRLAAGSRPCAWRTRIPIVVGPAIGTGSTDFSASRSGVPLCLHRGRKQNDPAEAGAGDQRPRYGSSFIVC